MTRYWIASLVTALAVLTGCDPPSQPIAEQSSSESSLPPSAPNSSPTPPPSGNSNSAPPSNSTPTPSPNTPAVPTTPPASTPKSLAEIVREYSPTVLFGGRSIADQYATLHTANEAPDTTSDSLYEEVGLLLQVGSTAFTNGERDSALIVFDAAYQTAEKARLKLGNAKPPAELLQNLAVVYYNGACVLSLTGKVEQAEQAFKQSIEYGFNDSELMTTDPDLQALREYPDLDPELSKLIQENEFEAFPFSFTVADLEGTTQSLQQHQGKVLIVDFWGTWCPPCKAEIPSFVKLQDEYGDQGLQIIGLNYENGEGDEVEAVIQEFIDANGINYPCAIGTDEIMSQVPEFGGFPTTLFIDRTGKVREVKVGLHDYVDLEATVKKLLAESPATN